MQKRLHFAVLVKGLFLTGKKIFPVGISHRTDFESLFAPPVKQGRRSKTKAFQQTSSGNLGVCLSGNLPPSSTLKIEYGSKKKSPYSKE